MYIIYFLLSIGSVLAAMFTKVTVGGVVFLLMMALLFLIIGTMSILSSRLEGRTRSEQQIISPEELRHFREQAEKNKQKQNEDNA